MSRVYLLSFGFRSVVNFRVRLEPLNLIGKPKPQKVVESEMVGFVAAGP